MASKRRMADGSLYGSLPIVKAYRVTPARRGEGGEGGVEC
jgi:hypothetical protein